MFRSCIPFKLRSVAFFFLVVHQFILTNTAEDYQKVSYQPIEVLSSNANNLVTKDSWEGQTREAYVQIPRAHVSREEDIRSPFGHPTNYRPQPIVQYRVRGPVAGTNYPFESSTTTERSRLVFEDNNFRGSAHGGSPGAYPFDSGTTTQRNRLAFEDNHFRGGAHEASPGVYDSGNFFQTSTYSSIPREERTYPVTTTSGYPDSTYNYQHQEPIIRKSVYVHVPPPDLDEYRPRQRVILPHVPPKKNYQIVFIKAPTAPPPDIPVIPPFPPQSDKTLIYVLHPKPEDAPPIQLPPPPEPVSGKPEVYFIKYKTQREHHDGEEDGDGYYHRRRYSRDEPPSSGTEEALHTADSEYRSADSEYQSADPSSAERATSGYDGRSESSLVSEENADISTAEPK